MNSKELFEFSKTWLFAWTGNRPEELIKFYTKDALYVDPAHIDGLKGHDQILTYFKKLLAVYVDWKWQPIEVFPTKDGFILKWQCTIPIGQEIIEEKGVDIVELEGELISRNEVYFDRTRLMEVVSKRKGIQRLANL